MRFLLRDERIRENAIQYLTALNIEGKEALVVEIKPYKKNRTLAQNRLYWTWMEDIGEPLGYRKDEMAFQCKGRFLLPILSRDEEQVYQVELAVGGNPAGTDALIDLLSTRDLTVRQFTEYLRDIEHFAGDIGIRLRTGDDYREAMG